MRRKLLVLPVAGAVAVGAVVLTVVLQGAAQAAPSAPAPAAVKVGTAKVLPLAAAQKAANAALQSCAKKGFPVAVAIVDRDGVLITQIRADGATGATIDASKGKAVAAAGFQSPTSALQEAAKTQPGFVTVPGFVILPGGLPIQGGGTVVAGIGVGGAPSGLIDEACATAGIQAIS
jgi:uncharacterized protein GlcG (DUF336 family)